MGHQTIVEPVMAGDGDILITDQHLVEPVRFVLAPSQYNENGELDTTNTDAMASFRFFGAMNADSDVDWFDNNVRIKIVYTYRAVKDEGEKTEQ